MMNFILLFSKSYIPETIMIDNQCMNQMINDICVRDVFNSSLCLINMSRAIPRDQLVL